MEGPTPQHAPRLEVSAHSRDVLGAVVPLPREVPASHPGMPWSQVFLPPPPQLLGPVQKGTSPASPEFSTRSLGPPSPPGCRVTSGAAVTGGLTLEQDPRPWRDQAGRQGPGAAEQEGGPHHRTPFPSCLGSCRHPVGGQGAPRPGSAGPVLPRTELTHTARFDPPTGWGCVLSEVVPGAGAWGGLASSWPGHPCVPGRIQDPPHCLSERTRIQATLEEVSAGRRGSQDPLSHAFPVPLQGELGPLWKWRGPLQPSSFGDPRVGISWQGICIPTVSGVNCAKPPGNPLGFLEPSGPRRCEASLWGFLDTHCSRSRPRPAPSVARWVQKP